MTSKAQGKRTSEKPRRQRASTAPPKHSMVKNLRPSKQSDATAIPETEAQAQSSAPGEHVRAVPVPPRREAEVLEGVRQGLTNKEIAARLKLSPFTVRTYVSSLLRRFAVPKRAALVRVTRTLDIRPFVHM